MPPTSKTLRGVCVWGGGGGGVQIGLVPSVCPSVTEQLNNRKSKNLETRLDAISKSRK